MSKDAHVCCHVTGDNDEGIVAPADLTTVDYIVSLGRVVLVDVEVYRRPFYNSYIIFLYT